MISVAGQDISTLSEGLRELLIVENTNGLYCCEALFGNAGDVNGKRDFLYFDRRVLDFGKPFAIKYGSEMIFDGRIMCLEGHFPESGEARLNVLAEDRFQDLRMTRRTRTFTNVSDADVITQIAHEHGLSPQLDVTGPRYKLLTQVNQSDLAFLRERLRSIDAELWMEGSILHASSHTKRNGGTVRLSYGRELREFSVRADLAQQHTSVTVSGWDIASKGALQYETKDNILGGELGGGISGASILAAKFGSRKEALAHTAPLSILEAQAISEAFFKMSARRFVVGDGMVKVEEKDISKLHVGSYVDLLELGPLFSGTYYLKEVHYLFDEKNGFRTEFTAERPGLGRV